ncbi:hypothetical protein OG985_21765 [Streptomyces sp. NBC_00289]|uniref:hypothetical protein n=1 Tax=Streptomyces sp. NBC_00289 TaxID=2975703 RepID=UPI0032566D18
MPIAVVRAETYYTPPPREPDSWVGVPAAELVWRWMEYRTGRRLIPPVDTVDEVYFARINQNRWLADCTSCGSAAIVSPTDPRFACTECQWGWCALVFPADPAAIEASLLALKPGMRNWWNELDPNNPDRPAPPAPDPGPMGEKA